MKRFSWLTGIGTVLAVACCLLAGSAQADFNVIALPDAAYTASTTLIMLPDGGSFVSGVSDIDQGIMFSSDALVMEVGSQEWYAWETWGQPPYTESSTPLLVYAGGESTMTFSLDSPVSCFGFEAQPDRSIGVFDLLAEFYNGSELIGSITIPVDGYAGARLFAAQSSDLFTDVTVSSNTTSLGFGVANFRYALPQEDPVPEPASLIVLGSGIIGLVAARRRKA